MREFCRDDFTVYLGGANGEIMTLTLKDILPYSFSAAEYMQD